MFKAFNSLQIVGLYAACPFGLEWLHGYSSPLFWTGCVVYLIFTGLMTAAVCSALEEL